MEAFVAEGTEVRVRCLLLIGDQAELEVPGQDEPARWPAAAIAAEAGVEAGSLPGCQLVVRLSETRDEGRVFSGFRLADLRA
jgi:hypothetical protein